MAVDHIEKVGVQHIVCRGCFAVLDAGDNFCRHCGASTAPGSQPRVVPAEVVPEGPAQRPRWSENPWVVLAMLFLVLGPLGLPMLWRSRQISTVWKAVLTVLVVGLTVLVIWLLWYVVHKMLQPLAELRNLRGF